MGEGKTALLINSNTNNEISQEFLDNKQYTTNGILRYEYIFGSGYISSGGGKTTEEILSSLKLKEGAKVLDIGCGIGGGCEEFVKYFGAKVHGIDLSSNAIEIAKQRYAKCSDLTFEVNDAANVDFPADTYDLIYSRDAILHLSLDKKKTTFQKLL